MWTVASVFESLFCLRSAKLETATGGSASRSPQLCLRVMSMSAAGAWWCCTQPPAAGGGWRWYQVLGCKRLWGSDERLLWNDCCDLGVSLLEQGDYAARLEFGVPAGIFLLALEQCSG